VCFGAQTNDFSVGRPHSMRVSACQRGGPISAPITESGHHCALDRRRGRADTALPQVVEQGLGLLQVKSVEALGEPAVDWGEQIVGLLAFTLIAQEPRHAHRGA
jgi:hypothetical protein